MKGAYIPHYHLKHTTISEKYTFLNSEKYRMLKISNLVGEFQRKGVVADVTELQILY